jgi:hypothetical protein
MPRCYLLALVGGSSLDRYSNNVTLFNLVEQLSFPSDRRPPPGAMIPLEVHAYFQLEPSELNQRFEMRFALVAETGLETLTDTFTHRSSTPRFRTRAMGLPLPPVSGDYQLRVDTRRTENDPWHRQSASWPLIVAQTEPKPQVTH